MQHLFRVAGPRHGLDGGFIFYEARANQNKLDGDQQWHQCREITCAWNIWKHEPAQHKDRTCTDMNQLATHFAFDPTTLCKKIHEAQEDNGNGKGKNGGQIYFHEICFPSKKVWSAARYSSVFSNM